MRLDNIGKLLRTNHREITPEYVRKTFRDFSPTMLWSYLERKLYMNARERYTREKKSIIDFYAAGLNTPELLKYNDQALELTVRTLELTDLVDVFQDLRIHKDDKLDCFRQGLIQLQKIHNLNRTHGDPYFKNFYRLDKLYPNRGIVYTSGFEYQRDSPDPKITDVLIFVADAIYLINGQHPKETPAPMSILEETYGTNISFPFDARDRFFFRARFGMRHDFFEYFEC